MLRSPLQTARASNVNLPGIAPCIFPRHQSVIETKIQGNCVNKSIRSLLLNDSQTPYRSTSPLPPSSPPPSTPPRCSSPIVNVVSSPGPPSNDDDEVPYVIPPGPYPAEKPDLSYAALIGQAILSSKEHRLSLQHIYEWISKVYPYYKRTDQIWMNSIRHVLSTSIVFRKVQRGQNKSLWAILDKDLPCFEGGGFDRRLCEDMNNTKSKPRPRKRRMETSNEPPVKRFKLERPPAVPVPYYHPHTASMVANPHLQPYYSAYSYPYAYANPAYFAALPPPTSYGQPQVQATATSSQSPSQPVPELIPSAGFSSSPVTSLKEPTSSQNTDLDDAVEIVNEPTVLGSDGIEPLATLLRSDVLDSDPPHKPSVVKVNASPLFSGIVELNFRYRRTTHPATHRLSLRNPPSRLLFHRRLHERHRRVGGLSPQHPQPFHAAYEQVHPLFSILPPHLPLSLFLLLPQTHQRPLPVHRAQTYYHLSTSLHPRLHPTNGPDSRFSQEILPSIHHLRVCLILTIPGLYWTKS